MHPKCYTHLLAHYAAEVQAREALTAQPLFTSSNEITILVIASSNESFLTLQTIEIAELKAAPSQEKRTCLKANYLLLWRQLHRLSGERAYYH